jgi:hypothetical protein
MCLCRPLVLSASLLIFATASRAADYAIKFQRPFKAGQAFAFSATDTYRATDKTDLPDGTSMRSSNFRRVALDADVRIDKVDDQGAVTVESITIQRLTLQATSSDSSPDRTPTRNLLRQGTELTLTFTDNQPAFALKKGGLIPDDTLSALRQTTDRINISDALFGTKERRQIGASWPIVKSALPSDPALPGYVDPAHISGTVTLKALRNVVGLECLQLEGTTTTRQLPVEGNVVPKEATLTETFTCNLPTDPNFPPVSWNMKKLTHIVTEEKTLSGNTRARTIDSEISHDASWTPKR